MLVINCGYHVTHNCGSLCRDVDASENRIVAVNQAPHTHSVAHTQCHERAAEKSAEAVCGDWLTHHVVGGAWSMGPALSELWRSSSVSGSGQQESAQCSSSSVGRAPFCDTLWRSMNLGMFCRNTGGGREDS